MSDTVSEISYQLIQVKMQQVEQKIDREWSQILKDFSPNDDNHITQQIAAIIRGKMNGINPVALMSNIINKHKTGDLTNDFPTYSSEELEEEFINLLNIVTPNYGDPISDEIAEIIQMKQVGIEVDALIRNVLSAHYQSSNEIIIVSDSDE